MSLTHNINNQLNSALADEYGYLSHQENDLNKALNAANFFGAADMYFKKAKDYVSLHASKTKEDLEKVRHGFILLTLALFTLIGIEWIVTAYYIIIIIN